MNKINWKQIWKALKMLPELIEFYNRYKDVIEQFAATAERFDGFITQVGENLDNVSKAAELVTGGYANAMKFANQFGIETTSVDALDEEIRVAEGVIKGLMASTAIGSREINSKEESISELTTRIMALRKRKEDLENATRTKG